MLMKYGPPSGWLDGFAYLWRVTGASRQFQARKNRPCGFTTESQSSET
ncbi:MAG: hypothetical protein ACI8T1_004112, partial [Verrucomicrobiales bacterium]